MRGSPEGTAGSTATGPDPAGGRDSRAGPGEAHALGTGALAADRSLLAASAAGTAASQGRPGAPMYKGRARHASFDPILPILPMLTPRLCVAQVVQEERKFLLRRLVKARLR